MHEVGRPETKWTARERGEKIEKKRGKDFQSNLEKLYLDPKQF
jgi:hypothetical protein